MAGVKVVGLSLTPPPVSPGLHPLRLLCIFPPLPKKDYQLIKLVERSENYTPNFTISSEQLLAALPIFRLVMASQVYEP